MEKYYNDAIIGNKEMIASFTKKGELIRLFYPNTDYRQFIDFLHTGVKINDSSMIFGMSFLFCRTAATHFSTLGDICLSNSVERDKKTDLSILQLF